jgi:glycoprotein endo-alpha-1,2-mannosidase
LSILTVVLCLALLPLASCGPAPTPTEVAVVPTGTAVPTTAAAPTFTLTPRPTATETGTPTPTSTPTPTPTPAPTLPAVEGPEPSDRVVAFYYPWYRNQQVDQNWIHWADGGFHPPLDIASDYYPQLGPYSSLDPAVVAQHFAWLREAGVGVIVSSWWGQRSNEDKAVPLLLEMGERYGMKVAFHVEPYSGRTATTLVSDVRYLYAHYGESPAFFRTTAASRWSPDDRPKGLFFLWSSRYPDSERPAVEASYWRDAIDAIHALPDGGLVISDETGSEWVDGGHFDGLYSYAVLQPDGADAYSWARALPPDAWYVPGVNPGFSAVRIGYENSTYVPRRDGAAYEERWQAALDAGVEPALVAITSFNEWHEGTQIEPAAAGASNGRGHTYDDYGTLLPDGYLALTRQWVDRFIAKTWPEVHRIRFRVVTSSDWTTFGLVGGATWLRPSVVSASAAATYAGPEEARFLLTQPLARANDAKTVEMVVDVLVTGTEKGKPLVFEIERGHLGSTRVELSSYRGATPVVVATFVWDGIASGDRNAHQFQVPLSTVLSGAP